MPRRKEPRKFKYTIRRKNVKTGENILYVKYPLPGYKNPVWRICHDETQTGVDKIIADIIADDAALRAEKARPKSVAEFFRDWLDTVRSNLSDVTFEDYEQITDSYILPKIGAMLMQDVTTKDVQEIYKGMQAKGITRRTAYTHVVCNAAFTHAARIKEIPENPVKDVIAPKYNSSDKEIITMTVAESKRFLEVCRNKNRGIIFEFALETGMRPGEYLGLRWSDVDFDHSRAYVRRAVAFLDGGGFKYKQPKNRQSRRSIALSHGLCERLKAHRADLDKRIDSIKARAAKPIPKPKLKSSRGVNYEKQLSIRENQKKLLADNAIHDLVFPSEKFTPISENNLNRRELKEITKKAGIKHLHLYCLRHTCATLLLQANVHPKKVQERLGHSSIAITMDRYSHVTLTMQQEATDKIAEILY